MGGGIFFAGEQFPIDLSAGALTVKEATKARSNLVSCGCARTHDSCYLGVRLNIEVGGFPAVRALAAC